MLKTICKHVHKHTLKKHSVEILCQQNEKNYLQNHFFKKCQCISALYRMLTDTWETSGEWIDDLKTKKHMNVM